MKKVLLLSLFTSLINALNAQDYKVSLIPDSLLRDANVVVRLDEIHVVVKGTDKAVITHKQVYTILNEAGDGFSEYSNEYDKFISLSDISGRMYDKDGKLLKSIKKKDIADVTLNDGESLVTDGRTKRFAFYNKVYPYTVEFEDEQVMDGILGLPGWQPVSYQKLSVQKSSFWVETPVDYQLRYKQFNYALQPVIENKGKTISYRWELSNQKAVMFEVFQPPLHEIMPTVYIAPTDFEFGGHKGNMSSWSNYGKFISDLYAGRDILPDNLKQEIHRLVDKLPSKEEKVKALYEYLQQNTHYVGIQLGIGGWQPFEAKYVAEKKYGDCKALSNFMVSMLKEAGIKANCVEIEAGEGDKGLFEDFPISHFNHIIACVPGEKDSIWLECTNQTMSCGYLGDATGNHRALMISEDGGHVVRTPNYLASDNLQIRRAEASIDENGNLSVDVNTRFTGTQQDLQHALMNESKEHREKYLNNTLNLPTYKVEKNQYHEIKGRIPVVDEYLKISSDGYASVTGKRLFILPNLFNQIGKLSMDRPRRFDIDFPFAYKDVDTFVFKIPAGYLPESVPKDLVISNKFGKYSINYKVSGNTIVLFRIHECPSGSYPASDYTELVNFYDQMNKADRSKVVLVKAG